MSMTLRFAWVLALSGSLCFAQDGNETPPAAEDGKEASAPEKPKGDSETDTPKTTKPKGRTGKPVVVGNRKEEVKVLRPDQVATELKRLKNKADIKAEIKVRAKHGKPTVFKGVIRNGKLIERFVGRRFRLQKDVTHPQCGVRLWWMNNSDGWMFFRYSNIMSLSITGKLTAKERREILRRLKAKQEWRDAKPEDAPKVDPSKQLTEQLAKMNSSELASYLLKTYPEEKGWNRERYRGLKRKQVIDNVTLEREQAIFVKYWRDLIKARLKALTTSNKKTEIEPGSAESDTSDGDKKTSGDVVPSGG